MGNHIEKIKGKPITENICLGDDGKYRWYYEYNMLGNPTLLYTCWRVMAFCMLPVYLLVCLATLWDGRSGVWEEILEITVVFAILVGCVMVVCAFAYLIVAAMYGWRYCVVFDMDEKGITHTQVKNQAEKAKKMSLVVMLLGLATRKSGLVGQGMLAGGHSVISSEWKKVKSVQIIRKHHTIKVNERLFKNQIYAAEADFDFVVDFIKQHVSKKCKILMSLALVSFVFTSCRTTVNHPPKGESAWPKPLAGVFVSDGDTLRFNGDGETIAWHFAKGMEPVGLQGEGTYVFLFDGKAWRYDAAERFEIYTTDKREVSFGLGTPGACNDSVITLMRYDIPGAEVKEQVFRKYY